MLKVQCRIKNETGLFKNYYQTVCQKYTECKCPGPSLTADGAFMKGDRGAGGVCV